jgi:hypothetical protein
LPGLPEPSGSGPERQAPPVTHPESTPPPPHPAKTGHHRPSTARASGENRQRADHGGEGEAPAEPPAVGRGTRPSTGQNRPEPATDPLHPSSVRLHPSGSAPGASPSALCARTGKKRQKPAAPRRGRRR